MLGLRIVCWAYLIWNILGRIVNFGEGSEQHTKVRCIDNVVIVVMIFILYFLYN